MIVTFPHYWSRIDMLTVLSRCGVLVFHWVSDRECEMGEEDAERVRKSLMGR